MRGSRLVDCRALFPHGLWGFGWVALVWLVWGWGLVRLWSLA